MVLRRQHILREVTGKGLDKLVNKPGTKIKLGADGKVHHHHEVLETDLDHREDVEDDFEEDVDEMLLQMIEEVNNNEEADAEQVQTVVVVEDLEVDKVVDITPKRRPGRKKKNKHQEE